MINMNAIKSMLCLFLLVCLASCSPGNKMEDARDAYNKGNYQKAYEIRLLHANKGNTFAQYLLGQMHFRGLGVPRSYGEAVRWFRLAAELPDEDNATYVLGYI